jgi:hypothetical protein
MWYGRYSLHITLVTVGLLIDHAVPFGEDRIALIGLRPLGAVCGLLLRYSNAYSVLQSQCFLQSQCDEIGSGNGQRIGELHDRY